MICSTNNPSTSNALKNLLVNKNSHCYYTNKEFNDKKEETINIFSAYLTPQIKEIHHPALLQEWKINLDAAEYEKISRLTFINPLKKKKIHRFDSDEHWPTSIKETIKWFTFPNIMEHSAQKTKKKG